MKLIVGLGNPGEKYRKVRHNTGFMVLDAVASADFVEAGKFNALVAKVGETLFVKPQTFMNNSGECVSKLVNFYNISLEDVIVIHDDVDIPLGEVKYQKGRGSAGHKGVESIFTSLGTPDFWRFRVGIGRPLQEVLIEDWVLMPFTAEELQKLEEVISRFTSSKETLSFLN